MCQIPTRRSFFISLLLLAGLLVWQQAAADTFRFGGVERVVAIGDVHGAYDELVELLQGTGLIDAELAWTGGEAHLVSLGDLLHRGDHGRQVMDLLMRLEEEADAAGGAVHLVLGNHEVMALTGDFRYISEGDYAQFGSEVVKGLPAGFVARRKAFSPDGRYGRWLLDKPVMVVVNNSLFVHGGVSEMIDGMSLAEINEAAMRDVRRFAEGWHVLLDAGKLTEGDDFDVIRQRAAELHNDRSQEAEIREAATGVVEVIAGLAIQPDGPLWYRGTSACHPHAEKHVTTAVLDRLDVRRVVIGHTPTLERRITSRMDGRVVQIDTGMNQEAYQGQAAALVIEGDDIGAVYSGGEPESVPAELNREWPRPYGMSDEEIEEFLRTAEVTRIEDVGEGVTRPQRLTLERDGRSMRAIFKTIDTDPGLERGGRWGRDADFADRYNYEIAAYKLDRLLGLQMVPVTVEREIDGQRGSVQYWVENGFNETRRREENIPLGGLCNMNSQYALMNAFDVLIFNVDRNQGDILYDRDWRVWLVDHSRSFGTQRGIPDTIREQIIVFPGFAEALERVNHDHLEILEPYLHSREIRALISRANWLRARR